MAPDAQRMNQAVRQHWRVENRLHGCMDVVFGDDQRRARTDLAAQNFAVQRLIAATSDPFRAQVLSLG